MKAGEGLPRVPTIRSLHGIGVLPLRQQISGRGYGAETYRPAREVRPITSEALTSENDLTLSPDPSFTSLRNVPDRAGTWHY